MPTCIHCTRSVKRIRSRGLCPRCYDNPDIRPRYPCQVNKKYSETEPTWAELEQMEREQRANLPDWWEEPDPEGDT